MITNQSILIAGDSWGAGIPLVHSDASLDLVYGGITDLLTTQGFQVINLSKPGGSNLQACDRMNDYLRFNSPKQISQIKTIIFWKTEFFREIWHYRPNDLEKELSHSYSTLRDHWVYRPYHRLAEISQQWNIPIYIIGGCSDTVWYDDFEKDFPGVKIACQSATNYILTGNHNIDHPVFCEYLNGWVDPFLELVKPKTSGKELEIMLNDMELGFDRIRLFNEYKDVFFPDKTHPNTEGQKILFNLLLDRIPELKN